MTNFHAHNTTKQAEEEAALAHLRENYPEEYVQKFKLIVESVSCSVK